MLGSSSGTLHSSQNANIDPAANYFVLFMIRIAMSRLLVDGIRIDECLEKGHYNGILVTV